MTGSVWQTSPETGQSPFSEQTVPDAQVQMLPAPVTLRQRAPSRQPASVAQREFARKQNGAPSTSEKSQTKLCGHGLKSLHETRRFTQLPLSQEKPSGQSRESLQPDEAAQKPPVHVLPEAQSAALPQGEPAG